MLKWKQGWGEEDLRYAIARIRAQDNDFCATLRAAIEAGKESYPIGVILSPAQSGRSRIIDGPNKEKPMLQTRSLRPGFRQQRTSAEARSERKTTRGH